MQRVVIIGCIGAGKSVFSERLSRITGLKLYNLGKLFWRTDGRGADRDEWRKIEQEITSAESWIIEGNYGAMIDLRLRRADSVILMDFSTIKVFHLIPAENPCREARTGKPPGHCRRLQRGV